MRWLIVCAVWGLSAAVLAPICFFAVILLAGPHSSMLPGFIQPLIVLIGWAVLLVTPVWIARFVWRRMDRSPTVE